MLQTHFLMCYIITQNGLKHTEVIFLINYTRLRSSPTSPPALEMLEHSLHRLAFRKLGVWCQPPLAFDQ